MRAAAGRPYGKCGVNSPKSDSNSVHPARADDIRPYVVQPGALRDADRECTGTVIPHS